MRTRARLVTSVLALAVGSSVLLSAAGQLAGSAAAIQLQLADLLFRQADYRTAMGVYQRVTQNEDPALRTRARAGTVRSALRIAEFQVAATHAAAIVQMFALLGALTEQEAGGAPRLRVVGGEDHVAEELPAFLSRA
jgi:hypothetical protein